MALSRFELTVILRIQVADRDLIRRAMATEASMEELARTLDADETSWALMGLGSGIDARLCLHNPGRMGEVAAEILATEGASDEVADTVRSRNVVEADDMSLAEAALIVSEACVEQAHAALLEA